MAINIRKYASIQCDGCGYSYDEMDVQAKDEIELLKQHGWTGTYRKCFCPDCSNENKNSKGGNGDL